MANYDAGHYFLNIIVPIDRNGFVEVGGQRRSVVNELREYLITLPTAQQDRFSIDSGLNSPFSRVPGTHFARLFVLDDVRYNGRRPSSPVLDLIFNVKMTVPQDVDHLPYAYLVVAIDFDAIDGSLTALRSYTNNLWRHMGEELQTIFGYCIGFGAVKSEQAFFDFVRAHQIETTMPFNDYWTCDPPVKNPVPCLVGSTGIILALAAAAFWYGWWPGSFWTLLIVTLIAIVGVAIGIIVSFGTKPFPPAPESDIDSVRKAVYTQQMFVGFAIDNMGKSDQELYDAFQQFCETHKPTDVRQPTQPPGVTHSEWRGS